MEVSVSQANRLLCIMKLLLQSDSLVKSHSVYTGYSGEVVDVSTIGYSDPGMTNSNMQVCSFYSCLCYVDSMLSICC